ncbi:MAG: efflux RND transporter periplasmic adaptor subunit, partial [Candidatus Omnitrophica bacterium]|nr:efflux RND transporter periplasmic adaptor subunit [Candidatus Omnitrophota bacterium]
MNRFRMVFIVVMVLALAAYLFYLAIQSTEKQNSQNIDLNTLIIPVVGVKVKSQNLSETINLVGTLQARDAVEIKSAVDGTIAKVDFTSGQKVKKGDPLITFSRDKFRASLMGAEANLSLARTTFSRYKLLLKDGGVSGLDLDQAANQVKVSEAAVDAARDDFDHTLVRAPFDGVMGEKLVSAGQFIAQGESLGFLVDQSSMKADFRIPERYLNRFKDGQAVTVKVDAYPQDRFNGKIVFIAPVVDESTRT